MSKKLLQISRDNELWRNFCFDSSHFELARRHRAAQLATTVPGNPILFFELQERARALASIRFQNGQSTVGQKVSQAKLSNSSLEMDRIRAMANWDPSYSSEKVDWYAEYIARHAPISISWLQQPMRRGTEGEEKKEVRGMGLYRASHGMKVVGPLDDGSVCIWDIRDGIDSGGQECRRGAILGLSKSGLLSTSTEHIAGASTVPDTKLGNTGIVECVSVDNVRSKAYFAIRSSLIEVDLNTLRVSSHERYPFTVSALSAADYPIPLTIGTTLSLHLHDPRQSCNTFSSQTTVSDSRLDIVANFPISPRSRNDFHRLFCGEQTSEYAPLFQPGPLSILNLPSLGVKDATQGTIYVAGRFPSLLIYDRRTFPKLRNTIHSGARLCSLTSLPHPFNSLDTDLMRQDQLSLSEVQEVKSKTGQTIIACGEYNGRGSLELYGLSPDASALPQPGLPQHSTYKNRASAATSKLLSVAIHGTRFIVSDGDGNLRWFERDGGTLVRRRNINRYQAVSASGLFNSSVLEATAGDVARKLLPTNGNVDEGHVDRDEVLLWTGEKIGLLGFREKPKFGEEEWEETALSAEEAGRRKEERRYGEVMRRALERQADEVRFVRGLGLRGGL